MSFKASQIDKDYKELHTVKLNVIDVFQIDSVEVTATASELNILDGVTATKDEINLVDNQVAAVAFVIGAEATNVINVGLQFNDAAGVAMATPVCVRWYLSGDSAGLDPSTVAPTVGTSIGTDGALIESVANLSGMMITETDGDVDIDIEDAGTPTFYLVVVLPNGSLAISTAITFV